jgi:response regulator NasT
VVVNLSGSDQFQRTMESPEMDAAVLVVGDYDATLASAVLGLLGERRVPIVVFADQGDASAVRAAVRAGVGAFVVDGFTVNRVAQVLDVAIERFSEHERLRIARDAAEERLNERKFIERAKGILMRRRNVSEDSAYQALRHMATERGMRVGDVARNVIQVEEMIVQH